MAAAYNERRILVIAGSDSSGGAGLEADQKVIAAHGAYAMTATTALTAQNTTGVSAIHIVPSDFVAKSIEACASDVGVDVIKTGMLACKETVEVVGEALRKYDIAKSVVDPVMVATSGARLLAEDAIGSLIDFVLPYTYILTPNINEATLLLSQSGQQVAEPQSLADVKNIAEKLGRLGPVAVLVKGGHLPLSRTTLTAADASTPDDDKLVVNVLYDSSTSSFHVFTSPYQSSTNTHGTGCSLASAIASNLTIKSMSLEAAVSNALDYVAAGIRLAQPLGRGSGPISHFHSLSIRPFAPGRFIPYLLNHPLIRPAWTRFTHHPFVAQLANGTLPRESYRHYLAQDYLYLTHFARANALAGYKATDLASCAASAEIVLHIARETALHVRECEAMGLGLAELQRTEEDQACTAYSRFILDTGMQQDWFALQMAMLPCLLGYGVVAARIAPSNPGISTRGGRIVDEMRRVAELGPGDEAALPVATHVPDNPYAKWIGNYIADDYTEAVFKGTQLVEGWAARQSPSRLEELVRVFLHATNMETGFWAMGLAAGPSEAETEE